MLQLAGMLAPALLGSGGVGGMGLMGLGKSLLMDLGNAVVSQLGQNLADKLLPDGPFKDTVMETITDTLGPGLTGDPRTNEEIIDTVAEATGMEPSEAAEFVQEAESFLEEFFKEFFENQTEEAQREGEEGGEAGEGSKGGSWIQILSESMGKIADKAFEKAKVSMNKVADLEAQSFQEEMQTTSETKNMIGITTSSTEQMKLTPKAKENAAALPSASTEMQGDMQNFSMIMSATANVIKTAGEGANAMARKQ